MKGNYSTVWDTVWTHVSACHTLLFCTAVSEGVSTQLTGNRAALHNEVHTQDESKYRPTHFKCSSLANPPSPFCVVAALH